MGALSGLQQEIDIERSITPQTAAAAVTGKIVDRRGFRGVVIEAGYGAITATNATMVLVVKEGDVTGTMASVADADLIGTELGASIAAGVRTSNVNRLVTKRVGYKGTKRYVQAIITPTVTAATIVYASVIKSGSEANPVAT